MFTEIETPRVFALPPGVDFAQTMLAGLRERLQGSTPETWGKVEIFLNTRRAVRHFEQTLVLADPAIGILPRLKVIGDIGAQDITAPAAVSALERQLSLIKLVRHLLEQRPDLAPKAAAVDLAASLSRLIDLSENEGVPLAALADIEVDGHAAHWQLSRAFLTIVETHWPNYLAASGKVEPGTRQRQSLEMLIRSWQLCPPGHPILVAGSTGSRALTRQLMTAVSHLPQGAVILPSVDTDLPAALWAEDGPIAPDHPQFGFAALGQSLGFIPSHLPLWHRVTAPCPERSRILSLTLRPAPVTDQWMTEAPKHRPEIAAAMENVTLLEAPAPRHEAQAIAVAIRQALETPGTTVALVTPDRSLARRVSAALIRWGIRPDDSAGVPLSLTPPGIFLRCIADMIGTGLTPTALVEVLNHPLAGGTGSTRGTHLGQARLLELQTLRGGAPDITLDGIIWPEGSEEWGQMLQTALGPLRTLTEHAPLDTLITAHLRAAETLSRGLSDHSALWEEEAGTAAKTMMAELAEAAENAPEMTPAEYRTLLMQVMSGTEVRDSGYIPDKRVAILGALEARMQSADLVIIGALNEGHWPSAPTPDPWLNRSMRGSIGLPLPEREIGLAAHDIQAAFNAPKIILTRSTKVDGVPTVMSRWLTRLTNLTAGLGAEGEEALVHMLDRGRTILRHAEALEAPDTRVMAAQRPSPAPPVSARPKTLSATGVERLIRDPYSIYASKILRLIPLKPLTNKPDERLHGTVVHKIMETFLRDLPKDWPVDALTRLEKTTDQIMMAEVPWPAHRQLWRAAFRLLLPELIHEEATRHQRGHRAVIEGTGTYQSRKTGVTLTARADRIDRAADGKLAIYDYKTGTPAGKNEIIHFAPQLLLQGLIAHTGGFDGVHPAEIAHLELVGLKKKLPRTVLDNVPTLLEEAKARFDTLMVSYTIPDRGYTARARPKLIKYQSDYDHLSRYAEWGDQDAPVWIEVGHG